MIAKEEMTDLCNHFLFHLNSQCAEFYYFKFVTATNKLLLKQFNKRHWNDTTIIKNI